MRKSTLLLSILLAVAVSTTADAAKRKMHRHHHRATVAEAPFSPNAPLSTMDQQMKFLHDAMFPLDTHW